MLHIDSLIAEIRSTLSNLSQQNLIDDGSIYFFVQNELRAFKGIYTDYDTIIEIKKGKGKLPDNFCSLLYAGRCEPVGYEHDDKPEVKAVLHNSLFWKERVEYGSRWNSCDKCCSEDFEKTIVENIYIKEVNVKFHYTYPQTLGIKKALIGDPCIDKKCRNHFVPHDPLNVSISGKHMYADCDMNVYIEYRGTPQDSDGKPLIPDSNNGHLRTYMEYFIKMKIFESVWLNGDDGNYYNKFIAMRKMAGDLYSTAIADVLMTSFDWSQYKELYRRNKRITLPFEIPFLKNL